VFRISRLTDYGIVLLAHIAGSESSADEAPHNARALAEQTHLPAPAVSKILKSLARAGLLTSHRGAKGGYCLARPPEAISVVDMITALEGPVAITECAVHPGACAQESSCHVRDPWQRINVAVRVALADVTLADLATPSSSSDNFVPLVALTPQDPNRPESIDV